MAINWSARYPGQIAVDPGWPYGKPRNVAVPGDGSGTPLEAAWVSDLAGWQAALLEEAGIAPSGNPDQVGASDYTNAIKALANAELGDITSQEHTWTAEQTFESGHVKGDWGVGGDVVYVDPATGTPTPRTVGRYFSALIFKPSHYIPASTGVAQYFWNNNRVEINETTGGTSGVIAEIPVPAGSTVTRLAASMGVTNIACSVELSASKRTYNPAGGVASVPLAGDTYVDNGVRELCPVPTYVGTADSIVVQAIVATTPTNEFVYLDWVFVEYTTLKQTDDVVVT